MKHYKVPANILLDLINNSSFCDALEIVGVDTWEGYEEANEAWLEQDTVPVFFEEVV